MARNPWLKERLPRLRFVRKAVRRFMPGEDADAAFAAAATLAAAGQGILFTRLGENLTAIAEADEVAAHYHAILDRGASLARPIELSVKPTQLGLDIDEDACLRHLDGLAARADVIGHLAVGRHGVVRLRRAHARPLRAPAGEPPERRDLPAGLPAPHAGRPPPPPAARAGGAPREGRLRRARGRRLAQARRRWTARTRRRALVLAEAARDGKARLALGTHDGDLVERIAAFADAAGVPRDRLEVHMLYGIRAGELRRLQKAGFPVSTLIAYGRHWYPWYMRRLAERPANVGFALRQLLP